MLHDLRYAIRSLRRTPGFTAAAVLCIALGIGANTAIFSLIEAVLLRPLPVPDPGQLAILHTANPDGRTMNFTYPQYSYLRDRLRSASVLAHAAIDLNVVSGDLADTPPAEVVSENYFSTLRVQPSLGRAFTSGDENVAIVSHSYWRTRLRSDSAILGRSLTLNGLPFTVIGVAPRGFFGVEVGREPALYVPLAMYDRLQPGPPRLPLRHHFWLDVVARVHSDQARAEADVLFHQANSEQTLDLPPDHGLVKFLRGMSVTFSDGARGISSLRGEFQRPLTILLGIVALVLLIACANVAALLIARATARRREVAVRLALGAGRAALVRQFFVESLVLSLAGGAAGLLFASWSASALVGLLTTTVLDVSPDPRVLAFTFAVAVLSGLLFGIAPAFQAGRQNVADAIKSEPPLGALRRFDLRSALVAVQVGISLALVVGAGLFIRTLVNLKGQDTGLDGDRVLLVRLDPGLNRYSPERASDFYDQLLDRVATLPGVEAASIADAALLSGANFRAVTVEGRPAPSAGPPAAAVKTVTPRFFETMGIALRVGRDFTPQDGLRAHKVAIVNEQFVREFLNGESPLGRRIGTGPQPDTEIVGVIADTKYRRLRDAAPAAVYSPAAQSERPNTSRTLHIRASASPAALAPAVRAAVASLDRDLAPTKVETFSSVVSAGLVRERMVATLAAFFGAVALLLVSIGLYGAIAWSVQRRTREIGIRMSLGAAASSVIWMMMRRAVAVVLAGIAAGVPLSLWLSRWMQALLFGVDPGDLLTLAIASLLLIAVAAVAAWLPARSAARIHPISALRWE